MRIAIIGDDVTMTGFVAHVLEANGHTCVIFRQSKQLRVALSRDTYDLLILDWNMPDMIGIQLMAWAQHNVTPCPPIVVGGSNYGYRLETSQ